MFFVLFAPWYNISSSFLWYVRIYLYFREHGADLRRGALLPTEWEQKYILFATFFGCPLFFPRALVRKRPYLFGFLLLFPGCL